MSITGVLALLSNPIQPKPTPPPKARYERRDGRAGGYVLPALKKHDTMRLLNRSIVFRYISRCTHCTSSTMSRALWRMNWFIGRWSSGHYHTFPISCCIQTPSAGSQPSRPELPGKGRCRRGSSLGEEARRSPCAYPRDSIAALFRCAELAFVDGVVLCADDCEVERHDSWFVAWVSSPERAR
jgi:hypothetical protein